VSPSGVTRWPPWLVVSLREKLDVCAGVTSSALDAELAPFMARFLVIRSSGYLEQAAFEVVRSYVQARSGGPVRAFAGSWLERTRNPTPENLTDLIGRFDSSWRNEFVELLDDDDERLKRELAYLVNLRNRIAHGLNEGVGREKALLLKDVSVELADWFILRFNPS
jgi:hypothetical protein